MLFVYCFFIALFIGSLYKDVGGYSKEVDDI